MLSARRCLVLSLFVIACGSAPRTATVPARNGLACAGRSVEDTVEIPELGPLPSGDAVTAGISLTCTDDTLSVLDWGPDSSASYVVARADAMAIWDAFAVPGTLAERRLRVIMLVEHARSLGSGAQ